MKRIVLLIVSLFAASLASVFVWQERTSVEAIILTNVEALSQVEHGEYDRCWRRIRTDISDTVVYCGTCSEVPGTYKSGMDFCK